MNQRWGWRHHHPSVSIKHRRHLHVPVTVDLHVQMKRIASQQYLYPQQLHLPVNITQKVVLHVTTERKSIESLQKAV